MVTSPSDEQKCIPAEQTSPVQSNVMRTRHKSDNRKQNIPPHHCKLRTEHVKFDPENFQVTPPRFDPGIQKKQDRHSSHQANPTPKCK